MSALAQPNIAANIPGYGAVMLSDVNRELARRDPLHFAWWLSEGRYQKVRHLQFISDRVVQAIRSGNARIVICAPPGHGKSELLSHHIPAWHVFKFPDRLTSVCAYGDEFATTWGRKVRDLLIENRELLGVRLAGGDKADAGNWRTVQGGGMICAGILGPIMGKRIHLFIVDDPVKNSDEAYSPTYQERLRNWYQSTASSRLEPGASVIVTMQRWPSSDFDSWLIEQTEQGREQWDVILLPAIAEADDALGRIPGEALWPEKWPIDALEKKRLTFESVAFWRSQWQQAPPEASTEGLAYHAFSAQHSVKECVYDPRLPLAWSLDFNVDPMCSVIGQIHENYLTGSKRLEILDEIFLSNSTIQEVTNKFIEKVTAWNPGRQLEVAVYGDAGGNQRLHSGGTDYTIAEQILRNDRRFVIGMKNPRSNPAVRDRVTTLNNAFLDARGERRVVIDPRCKELKKDLMFMRWKRDVAGNPLNDLDKSNPMRSHISDALGYLTWAEMNVHGSNVGFH